MESLAPTPGTSPRDGSHGSRRRRAHAEAARARSGVWAARKNSGRSARRRAARCDTRSSRGAGSARRLQSPQPIRLRRALRERSNLPGLFASRSISMRVLCLLRGSARALCVARDCARAAPRATVSIAARVMVSRDGAGPLRTPTTQRPDDPISGAPSTNRTCDQRFRKALLYPLSYGGSHCAPFARDARFALITRALGAV